jgi:hypothetical protein
LIWPGGNFTKTAVEMAREAGFKVGFTIFSRGPVLFNWIPQGEKEASMDDPLMVLPRYWSTAADVALISALEVSEAAKKDAEAVKEAELYYYNTYCGPLESD